MTPEERTQFQGFGRLLCVSLIVYPVTSLLFLGFATGLFIITVDLSIERGLSTIPRKVIFAAILTSYLFHAFNASTSIASATEDTGQILFHRVGSGMTNSFSVPYWARLIQLITNDFVVIWRTLVLYPDQKWPKFILCLLCASVIGFRIPLIIVISNPGPATLSSALFHKWSLLNILYDTGLFLSLITNLVATFLILHRLRNQYRSHRLSLGKMRSMTRGQRLLLVLVESGLVFCVLQVLYFAMILATPIELKMSLDVVLNVIAGCFWGFAACYPFIVFIFVHTESSIVETFGFSEALKDSIPDIEHPPYGFIAEPVPEDPATTSTSPTIVDLGTDSSGSCKGQISQT